jgi:hypothetical protein
MTVMTNDQQMALFELQSALPPELLEVVAEWSEELADISEGAELGKFIDTIALDVYRELGQEPHAMPDNPIMSRDVAINNIGFLLRLLVKETQPDLSEKVRDGLILGFVELLRSRMRGN